MPVITPHRREFLPLNLEGSSRMVSEGDQGAELQTQPLAELLPRSQRRPRPSFEPTEDASRTKLERAASESFRPRRVLEIMAIDTAVHEHVCSNKIDNA